MFFVVLKDALFLVSLLLTNMSCSAVIAKITRKYSS